jgi:hypothetical protein
MFRVTTPRGLAALGIAMGLALTAGIQASSAQDGPRALPGFQTQQEDQYRYDRRDDRIQGGQYGGQYDGRDTRQGRNPEERLDRRLAFLHERLRITAPQERLWRAFANVLHEEVQNRPGRREYIRAPSVVDRLEERERRLAERSQRTDHILRALRPLYASFSEEQKRTADSLMFQADGRDRGAFGRGGFGRGQGGFGFDRDRDRDGRFDRQDPDYR